MTANAARRYSFCRDVTYKYSLLSQQHGEDYDNDFEAALTTDSALYHDSEEEHVSLPARRIILVICWSEMVVWMSSRRLEYLVSS